ncbi:MAG: hypothetical protein P8X42_11715 [Calditrichaceae bacterium]
MLKYDFDIIREKPDRCAEKLSEGIVNSALITSVDYAKGKGSWKLLPDICIAVDGAFKNINLFFNKEIRDLHTVAVDNNDPTALALFRIIMQEKYEISPELMSIDGSLNHKLTAADAALISGNEAFNIQKNNKIFMDLGDEWSDLTGLPFVYGLWAVHEIGVNPEMVNRIRSVAGKNINDQDNISEQIFKQYGPDQMLYTKFISNSISYRLGLEEKEAINEFFRYAFFFGLIEHIPDLHFA